jgi:hypothetical protein
MARFAALNLEIWRIRKWVSNLHDLQGKAKYTCLSDVPQRTKVLQLRLKFTLREKA